MQRNVGGIDRTLRVVGGMALVAWALFGQGDYHLWGLVGLVPLVTGLAGWCPAYRLFGWNSCGAH
jgi:hypothetical protein